MSQKSRGSVQAGGATRFTSVYPVALCFSLATATAAALGGCTFNKDHDLPAQNCPAPSSRSGRLAFNGEAVTAATPPPPMAGGTMSVLWGGDGTYALASIPDTDRVAIVRLPGDDLSQPAIREIDLESGSEPGRIIGDGRGHAHIALRNKGAIATIDPSSGAILETRKVCPAPRGMVWQQSTDSILVACATGDLVTLPAAGGPATRRVFVDRDLRDVVLLGDKILVSRFREAEVLVLDGASGNLLTRTALPTMPKRTAHVAWRMTAAKGTVAILYELESTAPIDIRRREVAPVSYYNTANTGSGSPVVAAIAVSSNGTSFQLLSDPSVGLVAPTFDVAVSQTGTITTSGRMGGAGATDAVEIGTLKPNSFGMSGRFEAIGRQVQSLAYGGLRGGNELLLVQTREPATIQIYETTEQIKYPGAKPRWTLPISGVHDTGFDLFHTQTSSQIACASCHPEGGDDGNVWHFITDDLGRDDPKSCKLPGSGTPTPPNDRRTQSLRGGILQTAPFHWDGDMPEVSDIMQDVFTNGMNGGDVSGKQSYAVARWIDSIPRLPRRDDLDAARIDSGRVLFEGKGGCASCHGGSMLTNNVSVNIGNGGGNLQVPNLMGIGDRAPFLHDGCAKTLADRFDPTCGGDRHGNVLTSAEQADVVTYLESL